MVELSLGLRTVDLPFMVQLPDVTEEMFDELVDEDIKAELIDGVMIVHSPASMRHDRLSDFFRSLVRLFAKRRKLGSVFGPDSLVRLRPGRRFGPDMYFLNKGQLPRGRLPREFNGVPELMAEVLSPSNRRHDLEVKRPAYQEAGVKEIWLIDPHKDKVMVDRRRGKRYTTTTHREGRIESKVIPGFWIDASWLWQDELPDELDCLREILGGERPLIVRDPGTMIEVTVLGSGSALPIHGQTNSAYLVRVGTVRLLVDCGPAILQQLDAAGLTPGDVTHLFVTHRHGDHTLGYPLFLLWWLAHRGTPETFPTTISGEITWSSLEALLGHTFGEVARRAVAAPRRLFADREPAVLPLEGGITLRTWPMEHSDSAPVSGLRVEAAGRAVAFTGDTAPCRNTVPLASWADLLLHEASYSATLDPDLHDGLHGHSTARAAGRAAAAAAARRLALVHLSAHYDGRQDVLIAEAAREYSGEVTAPAAGTVYVL